MAEFLATLQNLFTFAFVVSSMLAIGLSLTVGQILQPLSDLRLVLLAGTSAGVASLTGEDAAGI